VARALDRNGGDDENGLVFPSGRARRRTFMSLYQPEPVEISTRIRPGEWTEESLPALVAGYREQLLSMGASDSEIDVVIDRDDGGGVSVVASWLKPAVAEELTEVVDDAGIVSMDPDAEPLRPPARGDSAP
jgi:hypothetical protein